MSSRPKLGYLVSRFPGQTHTRCWSEIAALEEAGVEVSILSTRPPPEDLAPHLWGEAASGRVTYLHGASPFGLVRALPALPLGQFFGGEVGLGREILRAAPMAARLVALSRAEGLAHVHVQGAGEAALIAALAQRMGGPSYSLHLPGPLSEGGAGQNLKWRGARFATTATARILNELRFVLREDLPRRVVVQPVGVDSGFFRREGAYVPVKSGQSIRLFSCGRIDPQKGFDDLLRALRLLLDRGHQVELAIAGGEEAGGGHRAELEGRAQDLRLGPHFRLLGPLDAAAVRDQMIAAHVFILPSWQEPLGSALMEAMSSGTPCIGTAAGGVRELVTDGLDGLLVQPKSPPALADAVLALSTNPELARRLSIQGRGRIDAAFDARFGAERLMREVGFLPMDHDDLMDDLPDLPVRGQGRGSGRALR